MDDLYYDEMFSSKNSGLGKPMILATQRFHDNVNKKLESRFEVLWQCDDRKSVKDIDSKLLQKVKGIATGGIRGASREIMKLLPNLEIVAVGGVGTDAIDIDYALKRDICVSTTEDVLTDDVADLAIGLLITVVRKICICDRIIREGGWGDGGVGLTGKVSGKRLGIVGLGKIGTAIAKRAQGFNMQIAYHSRNIVPNLSFRYEMNLPQLAKWCDFLMVTASGGETTKGLIDSTILESLGPNGVIINVARGSLVNEKALIVAITEGRIGGAGLDVFEKEPFVPKQLLHAENVVLSPHQGSATLETRLAMGNMMIKSLVSCLYKSSEISDQISNNKWNTKK